MAALGGSRTAALFQTHVRRHRYLAHWVHIRVPRHVIGQLVELRSHRWRCFEDRLRRLRRVRMRLVHGSVQVRLVSIQRLAALEARVGDRREELPEVVLHSTAGRWALRGQRDCRLSGVRKRYLVAEVEVILFHFEAEVGVRLLEAG